MWSKLQYHKLYRSLKQLPISEQLENSIFIDFIEKLLSFSRFDTILVIVNWLTKQAIFIPVYDTIMFINLAYLFVLYMFSKHSVSSHVISNKGLEFVSDFFHSDFFHSLSTALNMWLHFTSDYHSEGDGHTWIRLSSNTFVYIVITSNITSPNSYLLQSLSITML